MFDYRFTVAAQLSHREPLAYSVAPRTVPTLVSQFTNPVREVPFPASDADTLAAAKNCGVDDSEAGLPVDVFLS